MKNIIHSAASPVKGIQIEQIRIVELYPVQHAIEVFAFPCREIVEPHHFPSLRQYGVRQAGTDETRNPGDEINGHGTFILQDGCDGTVSARLLQ